MTAAIQTTVPYLVAASHVLLALLFLAILARKGWGKRIFHVLASGALAWGLLVALAAVSGSLFYSEIVGFEPCVLCWWQRVFIYPQLALFAVALWKRDKGVFAYSATLAALAGIVALYHSYVYWGGASLLPCTAMGGACSKIYVYAFGYITIPSMSLTVALYFLLLAWVNRLHARSH
jgi:disulfide bond formation protein DsbB